MPCHSCIKDELGEDCVCVGHYMLQQYSMTILRDSVGHIGMNNRLDAQTWLLCHILILISCCGVGIKMFVF